MARTIAALIVDDSEEDALLIERALRKGGFEVCSTRVQTAEEMSEALEAAQWDVVLIDFRMPRFDTYAALDLLQERGLTTPCIVVSGVIPMENALAFVKAGARDFVEKDDLQRLVPVLERELANRINDGELIPLRALFEALEFTGDPVLLVDGERHDLRIVYANPALAALVGRHRDTLVREPLATVFADRGLLERLRAYFAAGDDTRIDARGVHPEFGEYHAHWHVHAMRGLRYWMFINRGGYTGSAAEDAGSKGAGTRDHSRRRHEAVAAPRAAGQSSAA